MVASLALLYILRMLGLFMVLPVLTLYGNHYAGSSISLLGWALGVYGLSQACLQIPLGMLSDKWGRKPVILLGLAIFAGGSLVAAFATTIEGLIVGRILQGSGAIAGAVMAMVADLTTEENRTRAMAFIGASIGISFALALAIGPAIASAGGIEAVFSTTAILAVCGMGVLYFVVPNAPGQLTSPDKGAVGGVSKRESLGRVLSNPQLLRLNWGIFSLHAILMAMFVVVPGVLEVRLDIGREHHWLVYSLILFGSFLFMLPIMNRMERPGKTSVGESGNPQRKPVKAVFLSAVSALAVSLMVFSASLSVGIAVMSLLALFTFFVGFNLLEATLPSLVSKLAPPSSKGTALGIYSTSQFAGVFLGGVVGGFTSQSWGPVGVLILCSCVAVAWLMVASGMNLSATPQQKVSEALSS